jgi:hypothetical protein
MALFQTFPRRQAAMLNRQAVVESAHLSKARAKQVPQVLNGTGLESHPSHKLVVGLESRLVRELRVLVRKGQVLKARKLSEKALKKFPDSALLKKYWEVLAPPTSVTSDRQSQPWLSASNDWLRHHRKKYLNRWVALHGDVLLASGTSLKEVAAVVGDRSAFLVFVS